MRVGRASSVWSVTPPSPPASASSSHRHIRYTALTCGLSWGLQVNVLVEARFPNGLWSIVIPEEVELRWLPVRQCSRQHHPVGRTEESWPRHPSSPRQVMPWTPALSGLLLVLLQTSPVDLGGFTEGLWRFPLSNNPFWKSTPGHQGRRQATQPPMAASVIR